VGGGYKYCQLGPRNAFLRFPAGTTLRPVVTGWFSEFTDLTQSPGSTRVGYGPGPARFAGATYDFTSHYRRPAAVKFFEEQGLMPKKLRELSQRQIGLLAGESRPDVAGFLAIPTKNAAGLQAALRKQQIWTDHRGDALRLGPAPYVTDEQLSEARDALRQKSL